MTDWPNLLLRQEFIPIREDDCAYVWYIDEAKRCQWVRETDDCITDSVIQYATVLFCDFGTESMLLFTCGLVILLLWLLYLFLILGTTSNNFFCPSLGVIAAVLRLSENIAGVTILAFGNGAPDIFTSLVSGGEEPIIMFTELIGAGIFVTSVIAGSVALMKPFRVHMKPLMRDTFFYIASICWISYVVRDERVYLWEATSFVLIYVTFIVVVVAMQIYETGEERMKSRIPNVSDPDVLRAYLAHKGLLEENGSIPSIPRVPMRSRPFSLHANIDVAIATELERAYARGESVKIEHVETESSQRPKDLFKEFLYDINPISNEDWIEASRFFKAVLIIRSPAMFFLQLFIPVVNTTATKRGWSKLLNCFQLCVTPMLALFLLNVWRGTFGGVPVLLIFFLVGTVIGVIVFLTTHVDRVPKYHNAFAFIGFLSAMLTVYLVAGEIMTLLGCVGVACSISDAMLGITFLAWGNSIGDLISNVTIAKQGFPRMGYAACFGGPMFNTLLGLGLTYGIAAASSPDGRTKIRTSNVAPGCLAFLLCSLIATILYMNITGAKARRSYGYLLYSIYVSFILIQFLSEFRVIHPLGTDHRED